ncbi:hypothetical protein B566_EDAN004422 [Ephemera danica]|nr:hypothetical protein B566_EDAN004422 [Ephemera danica]
MAKSKTKRKFGAIAGQKTSGILTAETNSNVQSEDKEISSGEDEAPNEELEEDLMGSVDEDEDSGSSDDLDSDEEDAESWSEESGSEDEEEEGEGSEENDEEEVLEKSKQATVSGTSKDVKPEKTAKMEDPDFWRTVRDPSTGQDVVLGEKDLILIQRLQQHQIPDPEHNEYAPWVEWFSSQVMKTALRKTPEHKRSFLPSRSEKEKVSRMVHALKMGWREPRAVLEARREKEKQEGPKFYQLWGTEDESQEKKRGIIDHIPAPKRTLPGHAESYNPPPEYLFTPQEVEQWHNQNETPWKRKLHFIPEKYNALRNVPAYPRFVRERFMRCLDLYMAPRARKNKLTIEPEYLVPELPDPKDLQPFPTAQSLVFKGHTDMVRALCTEPTGQYIASGSDDCSIRVWEIATGRCVTIIAAGAPVTSVAWNPSAHLTLLAASAGKRLLLCTPQVGDINKISSTDELLSDPPQQDPNVIVPERVRTAVQWMQAEGAEWDAGLRVIINHFKELRQVTWHGRGDYLAAVVPDGQNRSVLVHQVSRRRSQLPFNRARGLVQAVQFHPVRPLLFVATQRTIRIYDLVKQQLVKKLMSNSAWISSMAVHPGGDNLLVGCYDCKTFWYDLDLSTKPYLNLRLHSAAVRHVAFHQRYPLDLLQNALLVPVKRLCYHEKKDDYGVFCAAFHPTQPWLFSGGADATIRLYT